ncbi:hypothetical protein [Psychromonas hadalis]|uniref:hypothetical protein n=1 Tax=Psychromonas hadalis TaxID=211669 RepID=UPI0003B3AD91|nr:hypothetical protein [Psychromonas hadalis]
MKKTVTNKKTYTFSIKRYLMSLLYLLLLTVSISVFIDDIPQITLLQIFFFMAMITLVVQSFIGLIANRKQRNKK